MTKVRVPDDTTTVSLTAVIGTDSITLQYGTSAGTKFLDKELQTSEDITLQITSSDGETAIKGKWRTPPGSGSWTDFTTNDAVTISQDFTSSSSSDTKEELQFSVSKADGSLTGDPILLLKTKEDSRR